ncbi:SGNH hydrolase-type esterase domain-containing protein [Staphylotrichum tortipilum]|uniref:SGNH hydrolase-type esterase domain-containing protein n=1 Tax=Staphylotrichum tortipilum TaxID=2831512 RepID=A0AAN6MW21_9PEZI|nr:SGNH hydrolase-type esterase domain-containing protein [Staphylotrichum longicolle]
MSSTRSGLRRLLSLALSASYAAVATCHDHWVDIWACMPQQVEIYNLPNAPYNTTEGVFQNTTIRQTVYITQDASTIRFQLSNAFGGSDLPITAATIALPVNGTAGSPAIRPNTLQHLTFSGSPSFQIPNGAVVLSDPVRFPVKAQTSVTITLYLAAGQAGHAITGHPGSRTSTWLTQGNLVSAADVTTSTTQRIDKWFLTSSIQAWLDPSHTALAIVGDSITDGRGSTTNGNDRWPNQLLARTLSHPPTRALSIMNMAAGGNRVLADGLGPAALGRIERDVLAHPAVRYALIYEGVNDLGTAPADTASQTAVADRLVLALDQMVTRLHGAGIAVFGGTITPMSGPGQVYGEPAREVARQRVNKWIRTSGRFDAVVDFDAAVRDKNNGTMLRKEYDSGDYLHLNPAGYKAMAAAVDLKLFQRFEGGVSAMV